MSVVQTTNIQPAYVKDCHLEEGLLPQTQSMQNLTQFRPLKCI
jgi:hypothetical protein